MPPAKKGSSTKKAVKAGKTSAKTDKPKKTKEPKAKKVKEPEDDNGLPKTLEDIIKHMDELEPDKNYYERQADARNKCSKTQKKLRDFANKNPDHEAIRHWVDTKKWQPPDEETLTALMELIKTMIK